MKAPAEVAAPVPAPVPAPDRIVREAERREITGISAMTAWRLERQGRFPRRRKLYDTGRKADPVGWRLSELMAWIESREPVDLRSAEDVPRRRAR